MDILKTRRASLAQASDPALLCGALEKQGICVVGAAETGNRTVVELSRIYNSLSLGADLVEPEKNHDIMTCQIDNGFNPSVNHLHIHSFPSAGTANLAVDYDFIILTGAVDDPGWRDARKTLHENKPYFMLTIGVGNQAGTECFQPFPEECLVLSALNPHELALLVLQIIVMHRQYGKRAALTGYDIIDIKNMLAGRAAKAIKITASREQYRHDFSSFLSENKAELSRSQGMVLALSIHDIELLEASDLLDEINPLLQPDADFVFTLHDLPEDEPYFMAMILFAL